MRLNGKTSITRRLTLLFVFASSSVLLVLGLVIASSVDRHFEEQDMEMLTGKMELIRHTVETLKSDNDLKNISQLLNNSLIGHHGLEVMVVGPNQEVLFSTLTASFPMTSIAAGTARAPLQSAIWTRGDQNYRGIAAEMNAGTTDRAKVIVAVAIDMSQHHVFMQSFMQTLWLFVVGAAVLSGFLGWVSVRRGLAPLRAMREQTNVVTALQLNHRLPVESIPIELGELAQSLNDMLERLEEAFLRLSGFSSDIAHELRTPVSNLMTQTQVALSRERSAADYKSILESNAEELDRMARMISDMLLLAKAENGLVVPNRKRVSLASEALALFDYYDAVADEKGLDFSLEGHAEVMADRLMLRRALGNLLSNAVRHSTPNTSVFVTIHKTLDAIEVSVKNTGEPIAHEHLERIFDRFFRVDPSRQRSNEGTGLGLGLGLAITKSIVIAHGGTISATSLGSVTTFTIRLALAF